MEPTFTITLRRPEFATRIEWDTMCKQLRDEWPGDLQSRLEAVYELLSTWQDGQADLKMITVELTGL